MKKKKSFDVLVEVPCPRCATIMVVSDSGKHKNKEWLTYKCPKCKYLYTEEEDFS
mgnify:CR=1 FL=1